VNDYDNELLSKIDEPNYYNDTESTKNETNNIDRTTIKESLNYDVFIN